MLAATAAVSRRSGRSELVRLSNSQDQKALFLWCEGLGSRKITSTFGGWLAFNSWNLARTGYCNPKAAQRLCPLPEDGRKPEPASGRGGRQVLTCCKSQPRTAFDPGLPQPTPFDIRIFRSLHP